MDIAILNGNPDPGRFSLDSVLANLNKELNTAGHRVNILNLRDLKIKFCTGCWSCWWGPTPGECIFKDQSAEVCREVIRSDLVIMASPVLMGFPSADLKKVLDKLIPLLHPYIKLVNGESHHRKRYDRYPLLGLILERDVDTDDEDVRIINRWFRRFSLNFRTRVLLTTGIEKTPVEVLDAIGSV